MLGISGTNDPSPSDQEADDHDELPSDRPKDHAGGTGGLLRARSRLEGAAALVVLWIALAAPMVFPMFRFVFYHELPLGHDARTHIVRSFEFKEAVSDGQIPPALCIHIEEGRGYPAFLFYPPLFDFLVSSGLALGLTMPSAVGVTLLAIILLSTVGMYFLSRLVFSRFPSILSAWAFGNGTYFLTDLLTRSAWAELLASAWIPWLILFGIKTIECTSVQSVLWLAVSTCGIVLGHCLMGLMALPIVATALLFLGVASKRKTASCYAALGLLGGVGLSSFYWLPAIMSRDCVNIMKTMVVAYPYSQSFLGPADVLWGWNSIPMLSLCDVVCFIALGVATCAGRLRGREKRILRSILLVGTASLFMTLRLSAPVWENLPILHHLQFPWRYLSIFNAAVAIGAGVVGQLFVRRKKTFLAAIVGLLFAVVAVIRGGKADFSEIPAGLYNSESVSHIGRIDAGEYTPRWAVAKTLVGLQFETLLGPVVCEKYERRSFTDRAWTVNCAAECAVVAPVFYLPGWRVTVDDQIADTHPDDRTGLLSWRLTPGKHTVQVQYCRTRVVWIGQILSAVALAVLLCIGGHVLFTSFILRRRPACPQ